MNTATHTILTRGGESAPVGLVKCPPVSTFIRLLFCSCTDPTAHWNRTRKESWLPLYFPLTETLLIKFRLYGI